MKTITINEAVVTVSKALQASFNYSSFFPKLTWSLFYLI